MAGKKFPIDEKIVLNLAKKGFSNKEIGEVVGCDHDTIRSRFSKKIGQVRKENGLTVEGRPVKKLDTDILFGLASVGATYEEMAHIMKVSMSTIDKYKDLINEGQSKAKVSVRRKQLNKALVEGDTKMLIHVGKTFVGQVEKKEITQHNTHAIGEIKPLTPSEMKEILESDPASLKAIEFKETEVEVLDKEE